MYAFEYVRANSVRGAASALAKHEDSKILAGGHTLLPTMKQRLASPSALIDLGAIKDLAGIEQRGRSLDHRRHDHACGGRGIRCGEGVDPRACGDGPYDRRPRGAQPRHHRGLDRQ